MKAFCLTGIISLAALTGFISCEKHQLDKPATPLAYTLTFSSPTVGRLYNSSDSVQISAIAIYKENIHGYDIAISRVDDTTALYFAHVHDHNDTLHIDQKWKSAVHGPAEMQARITLYLDHDGNTGTGQINFKIQ